MCGIYGTNCLNCKDKTIIKNVIQNQRLLTHRGPDCYFTKEINNVFLAHHRLAIIDISSEANQPFTHNNGLYLSINGEIYNYKEIYNELNNDKTYNYNTKSNSDCEVIIHLYDYLINHKLNNISDLENNLSMLLNKLDGIFSFILYDETRNKLFIARDPFGVTSLYYGFDKEGYIHISSEIKAFTNNSIKPYMFPAGEYIYYDTSNNKYEEFITSQYYQFLNNYSKKLKLEYAEEKGKNYNHNVFLTLPLEYRNKLSSVNGDEYNNLCQELKDKLIKSVLKRLQSNVPFAILLSGGLDSSLICSIACKLLRRELPEYNEELDLLGIEKQDKIHTFSIGFEGSPDLEAAQKVANYLKTEHHSIIISMEEALLAIRDVIWYLETYDVTTIRASTPMFLLSKRIKALGFKMILSGEGSDEIFGGYLYFHQSPNEYEFAIECVKRVSELQYFDNLRANKSTLAWGLEVRVPFLDKQMVEFGLTVPRGANIYNEIEKFALRDSFSTNMQETDFLPNEILWRKKEQFSDGVGYQWIDKLKEIANNEVSDLMMVNSSKYFNFNIPITKEEYYYREMFKEIFNDHNFEYCVKKWIPNSKWSNVGYDPSGRAQKTHQANLTWN